MAATSVPPVGGQHTQKAMRPMLVLMFLMMIGIISGPWRPMFKNGLQSTLAHVDTLSSDAKDDERYALGSFPAAGPLLSASLPCRS